LNLSRQQRLATLAGVTSLAATISTSLLRETRLAFHRGRAFSAQKTC
jgi:hypothetical protein